MKKLTKQVCWLAVVLFHTATLYAHAKEVEYDFNIQQSSLGHALDLFVKTTKLQLIYPHSLAKKSEVNAVVGRFTAKDALIVLLRDTDFSGGLTANDVLIITDKARCKQYREHEMDNTKITNTFFAGLSIFCTMAAPTIAVAQEEVPKKIEKKGDLVEQITVTAQRRAATLDEVPLSIVAESQVTLDKKGIRSIDDIARLQPSITFGQSAQYFGPGQSQIAIRGIASSSGIPTTGVYIDDSPIQIRTGVTPSLSNPYPRVFDLERLEVLNGPQGTLFGTGSMGGAVRFITPEPNYDLPSLYIRSELATTKNGDTSYEAGVAFGAPLVEDKIGFRGSIWTRTDGGYIDRLDRISKETIEEDINSEKVTVARLAFGFRATDELTITPTIFYQDLQIDDSSRHEVAASSPSDSDFVTSLDAFPQFHNDEFYLPAVRVEYEMKDMIFISNTSYLSRETSSKTDDLAASLALNAEYSDSIPATFADYYPNTYSETSQKVFTQEFRLQNDDDSRLKWVVGLHYQHATTKDSFDGDDSRLLDIMQFGAATAEANGSLLYGFFTLADINAVSDVWGVGLYQDKFFVSQDISHKDKQAAIFAQADYAITEKLTATVGLRYTKADYEYTSAIRGPLFFAENSPADYETNGTNTALSSKSSPLTPKFGLAYQADKDNLFYANVAKGFRGSGISEAAGSTCAAEGEAIGFDANSALDVKEDTLWSYEIGSKNSLFGGMLNVDAAVYHMDWSNVQFQFLLPECQKFATLNQGDAKIDGFNLSFVLRPIDGLTIGSAIAYTDASYSSDFVSGDTVIRRAGEPFDVNPWAWTLNAEYVHYIEDQEYYGRFDFSKRTQLNKPVDINSPLVDPDLPRPPGTEQLNLRFGVRYDAYDLSLFVNNVTNEHPELALAHDGAGSKFYRAGTFRPRTLGVTFSMRY